MIKAKNGKIKIKGEAAELLAGFTAIAFGLKEVFPEQVMPVFNDTLDLIKTCDSPEEFHRIMMDKAIQNLIKLKRKENNIEEDNND